MAKSVTQLELEITGKISDFESKMDSLDSKLDSLGKKGKSAPDSFKAGIEGMLPSLSKANIAMGAAAIAVAAIGKGIGLAIEKQTALAGFSAITGVAGEKLEAFGDAADELAMKFGTSAVDNIEAFKGVLSRLGPDFAKSADAVRLMGDNINTLATASGLDATTAMDALTTAMLQFGVDLADPLAAAKDAQYMMNVMAAAAKEGAMEIPQLSEALVQTGGVASSLGVSFEETNAALETLATGGKYGAEAGVALRNVMTSMVKVSKLATDELQAYGISSEELGQILTTKGVNAAMLRLKQATEEHGTAAQDAALMTALFGKENISAAGTLIKNTELTDKLTEAIGGTTTAQEQAAVMMDTVAGRWDRVGSRMDVYLEKIGSFFMPMMEALSYHIGKFIESIEATVDGVGKLFSGDFGGAWDSFTGGAKDAKDASEGVATSMRKTGKATGEETEQSDKLTQSYRNQAVVSAELSAAKQAMSTAKSADEEKRYAAMVARLTQELRKWENQTKKTGGAHKEQKDVLKELQAQYGALRESQEGFIGPKSFEGLNIQPIQELSAAYVDVAGNLQLVQEATEGVAVAFDDANVFAEAFGESGDMIANAAGLVGDAFGGALVGQTDKLKESLKQILNLLLDTLQAELLAASAASAIRALFTAGVSLTTDGILAALAYGAVEVAQGAISSFAVGTPYVPYDQTANIHKGERIMTAKENKEYTSEKMGRNPSGALGRRRVVYPVDVNIHADRFASASNYDRFQKTRQVF